MSRVCFIVFIFFIITAHLFAFGKREESETVTQNDEWILCITEFDVSSLPEDKTNIAPVVNRKLVTSLSSINFRTRISPEYTYYEDYAWANQRSDAARALAVKQEERSRYVFRGDVGWIYRQNIARIDKEIETLKSNLEEIENNAPLINKEPEFNLTSSNLEFTFPHAPRTGNEFIFCNEQKADAFLAGTISDFHGRYFLAVKLYTVYTRSFVWQDAAVFSLDDIDNAVDELIRRMMIVLSGNRPAVASIRAEPEETLVLINRSFAGRGETPLVEYPPGTYTITAKAQDYESLTFETEFFSGELHDISIRLNPIEYGNTNVFADTTGSVYLGSLYAGEAPLTLRLPVNQMEYILLEKNGDEDSSHNILEGALVFQTPEMPNFSQAIFLRTGVPLESGQVEKMRSHYYWTWAGTWITGIAAWLSYYTYLSMNASIRYHYATEGEINQEFYDDYVNMYDISRNTMIAMGVVTAYGIYRLVRYLYAANKNAMPSIRRGRN